MQELQSLTHIKDDGWLGQFQRKLTIILLELEWLVIATCRSIASLHSALILRIQWAGLMM